MRSLSPRRHPLVWLALALAPAFSLTALVSDTHRTEYSVHAQEWHARGELALREARYTEAVDAFRSALRFAREDRMLRLRLAEALAAAGRGGEARAYLQGLWQEQPGNGRVNLELARLAAAAGQTDDAIRYYQNAIQGAWQEGAELRRRETRLELAELLVGADLHGRAEAELIALAAELPPDAPTRHRMARLLSAAGSHRRALDILDAALETDPRDVEALRGAGYAALALGDHAAVVRYLQRVPADAADSEVTLTLEVSRHVLALDPYRRGLSARNRAVRARQALERAGARLKGCAEGEKGTLAGVRQAVAAALRTQSVAVMARDAERLDTAFALALATIRAAEGEGCGPLTPADRALLLLAGQAPEDGR